MELCESCSGLPRFSPEDAAFPLLHADGRVLGMLHGWAESCQSP